MVNVSVLRLVCMLLLNGAGMHASAQLVAPQLRTIGTKEGLSHDHVWDLAMDQRGHLWVATSNGLDRFDGRNIKVYRAQGHARSLPGDLVTSLAVDTGRRMYVGTNAAFLTIIDVLADTLHNVPLPIPDFSRHGEQRVTDILIDRKQRIWVAHGARCISRFDPRTSTFTTTEIAPPLPTSPSREVIAMIDEGNDGTLWLSMFKGLVRFDPERMSATPMNLHPAPGQPDHAKAFQARGLVDEDSTLVFGTWSEGIFRMRKRDGQLTLLWPSPDHIPTFVDHMVTDMVRVSEDKAMVACIDQGLLQLDLPTGRVDHFDRSLTEESSRRREDMFVGCYRLLKAGDLLVLGSTMRGIALWPMHDQLVRAVPLPMHAPGETIDEVVDISYDPQHGEVHALSFRRGLFIYDSTAVLLRSIGRPYKPAHGYNSLQRLPGDRVVLGGTPHAWVFSGNNDRGLKPFMPPGSFCGEGISWVRPDGRNGLWCMAGGKGLFHLDTITGACRPLADVQPQVAALSRWHWDVFIDRQGRSWFLSATNSPVVLHPDGRVERVEGPPSLAPFEVSDIAETPDGRIWLAAKHTGLAVVEAAGPIKPIDVSHGLPSRNVMQLSAMQDGTLWMVVPGALMHWDPRTAVGRLLGPLDGIPAGPLNLDPSHAPLRYPVLVGTWEGFCMISRESHAPAPGPVVQLPLVLCMDTVARRNADLEQGAIVFPHTAERITVLLRTTNLVDPMRDQLAYRLVGHSGGWSVIGPDERITFNSLPHGRYRFEVKARNNGGPWGTVTTLPLIIRPPFRATWWFRSIVALAIMALGWAVFRIVLRNKLREQRRRMERENALLEERIRIAHDLHDDLGSGLASIGMESALAGMGASDPGTRAALLRVSESARNVGDDMRRIIWAMGSGQETLGDLLAYVRGFAAEMLDQAGAVLGFHTEVVHPERKLSMEQRRHLVLFTKEALHNVVKHAAASRVKMTVQETGDRLLWSIRDDGKGYLVTERDGAGTGTVSMRERARLLGAELVVDSIPGTGTHIELRMVLAESSSTP